MAGSQSSFTARASDTAAPVSGLVFSFEGDSFGTSACRVAGPGPRPLGPPFAGGSTVEFSLPHVFGEAGASDGAVRVDSGGCGQATGSVLQPFTATVTDPGQPARPIELGDPIQLLDGPVTVPPLPGVGDLPALNPLEALQPLATAACSGASSRIRHSLASRSRGRTAILCLLNRERRVDGLRPLGLNGRLARAAAAHARAMIRGGFFSHFGTSPPGRTLLSRLRRSGYLPAHRFLVGENLAYGNGGAGTPSRIVRAWMHSTTHRQNILAPGFREIGIGIEPGSPVASNRGVTYTTDFGRRR